MTSLVDRLICKCSARSLANLDVPLFGVTLYHSFSSLPTELIDQYLPLSLTPSPHYAPLLSIVLNLIHFLARAPLRQSYKVAGAGGVSAVEAGMGMGMGPGGVIKPVDEREINKGKRWDRRGGESGSGGMWFGWFVSTGRVEYNPCAKAQQRGSP